MKIHIPILTLAIIILLNIILATGWILNVYKITQLNFESPYKAEIIRGIGLLPPIGGVLGWIHIND